MRAKKQDCMHGTDVDSNSENPRNVVKETVVRLRNTNAIWYIHHKIERTMAQAHLPEGQRRNRIGAGAEEMGRRWIQATKLNPPKTLHGCAMGYRAISGVGEIIPANVDNAFFFPDLPPEIEALESEPEKSKWLRDYMWRGFDDGCQAEPAGPAEGAVVVLRADYFGTVAPVTRSVAFQSVIDFEPTKDGGRYEIAYRAIDKHTGEIIRERKEQTVSTFEQAKQTARILAQTELREVKEKEKKLAANTPEPFAEPPPQVDPADQHKLAGAQDRRDMEKARLNVLRRKWPRSFRAMDEKADAQTVERAYLLDVAELTGHGAFPPDTPRFAKQVADALSNHSRRTKKPETLLIDYAIAFYWPKLQVPGCQWDTLKPW